MFMLSQGFLLSSEGWVRSPIYAYFI